MLLLESQFLTVIAETDAVWDAFWPRFGGPPDLGRKFAKYADNFQFALGIFTHSVESGKWTIFVLANSSPGKLAGIQLKLDQELARAKNRNFGEYLVVGKSMSEEDISRTRSFLRMDAEWRKDQPKPPTLWERLLL